VRVLPGRSSRTGTAIIADMSSRLTSPSNWWVMLRAVT
jgi:hypothetical protein